MIKVRIQLVPPGGNKSPFNILGKLIKNEGISTLYKGWVFGTRGTIRSCRVSIDFVCHRLDAGIIRQLTYTTTRMGVFRMTSDALKKEGEKTTPLWKKAFAGLFAGAVG